MSALPETSALFSVLQRGELSRAHVERFAAELAACHGSLLDSRSTGGPALGYAEHVGSILKHVSLHEGRMVLERPRPFGRVWEESAGAASDVAGVMLELDVFGKSQLAHCFLASWLNQSGAFDALEVLRAQIARAALLAREPVAPGHHERPAARVTLPALLAAARARLEPSALPFLVITHGLSGSGKTTATRALVGTTPALAVSNDAEAHRLRFAGVRLDPGVVAAKLESLALRCMRSGWPVIVESCFLSRDDRQRFRATARAVGVPFAIVHCTAPLALIGDRLERRRSFGSLFHGSDAEGAAVQRELAAQIQRTDPLDEAEQAQAVVLDTAAALDVARMTARLYELLDGGTPATWRSSAPEHPPGSQATPNC